MASTSRKKQDEKNLKTLRELGALPQNKYCFDCNQRGPTYVNVTIGSFVCTKCSGMLRGLTPPHRVKSISMATFTNEEIELLKNRGNDYCRGIWLGLYENTTLPSDFRDEQSIRDFMVDKYERKRYYLDPAQALKNGYTNNNNNNNNIIKNDNKIKPLTKLISDPKPIILNGNNNNILDNNSNNNCSSSSSRKRPEVSKKINHVLNGNEFDVNFEKADIFTANNSSINGINGSGGGGLSTTTTTQPSFANFDDNPVFNNTINNTIDEFSIFDLKFTNSGPVFKQVPLFPKCNMNRWSMPTETFANNLNQTIINNNNNKILSPPTEDKYAALKDLDNALKSKNGVDWNSSGSTGSLYSSSTPTGSMYSSPSPQSSMFGSPCQGQFINTFQHNQDNTNNGFSNPFNNTTGNCNGLNWSNATSSSSTTNGFSNNIQQQPYANPFRDPLNHYNNKMNGFTQNFQPVAANGATSWGVNPFKIGTATTNINSNNPFL